MDFGKLSVERHLLYKGKIETKIKFPLANRQDLSIAYTPGIAEVSKQVSANPDLLKQVGMKGNSIAVVSDGSAVLGLGDIGPEGAYPVMEGKAVLFKHFANIDAIPIVLNTKNTEEIISVVKAIAPSFSGINLEDISAPRCFEIEERLKAELDIPIFHDDQHGTAIVVLAALINASKVLDKDIKGLSYVICGAGAAGTAILKLLSLYGIKNIVICDSKGIISRSRDDLNESKASLLDISNPENINGDLSVAIESRDVFIGVSGPNIVNDKLLSQMNKQSIVFALANPVPEVMPEIAKDAGASIIATGRSDYPNQINNVLAFPGVFRGAIDNKVSKITDEMKINAAESLASLVKSPTADKIIPGVFERGVVESVAKAII